MFHCDNCGKNFSVKFKSKEENKQVDYSYGHIVVVENVFCEKQIIPLMLGDNMFGRRCLGTEINAPIQTGDMSMDRKHCIISVEVRKDGEIIHRVADYDSLVGTFVMNDILQKKERRILEDGDIITLGATTLILKKGAPE
jgi:pSer/pThr/pTyr-binding forkhead associated (FHA) protein